MSTSGEAAQPTPHPGSSALTVERARRARAFDLPGVRSTPGASRGKRDPVDLAALWAEGDADDRDADDDDRRDEGESSTTGRRRRRHKGETSD